MSPSLAMTPRASQGRHSRSHNSGLSLGWLPVPWQATAAAVRVAGRAGVSVSGRPGRPQGQAIDGNRSQAGLRASGTGNRWQPVSGRPQGPELRTRPQGKCKPSSLCVGASLVFFRFRPGDLLGEEISPAAGENPAPHRAKREADLTAPAAGEARRVADSAERHGQRFGSCARTSGVGIGRHVARCC